jgi:cation transport regulator ChaB
LGKIDGTDQAAEAAREENVVEYLEGPRGPEIEDERELRGREETATRMAWFAVIYGLMEVVEKRKAQGVEDALVTICKSLKTTAMANSNDNHSQPIGTRTRRGGTNANSRTRKEGLIKVAHATNENKPADDKQHHAHKRRK